MIIECIIHQLLILIEFNLFWIFRSFNQFIPNITSNLIFELSCNLFFYFFIIFLFLLLFIHLLLACIDNLNNHIHNPQKSSNQWKVKTWKSNINHSIILVVIKVIEKNEYLNYDNTDTINKTNDDFYFAFVCSCNNKIYLECQM